MMGINAAKAVEIGEGIASTSLKGSQNNDGNRFTKAFDQRFFRQMFLDHKGDGLDGGIQ
ncbi:MAG TPA: chorismate synthase [Piscirickettsiaceae bacterium]|nr:chorismate synthase [Piscirickettsiaceae bacterium]